MTIEEAVLVLKRYQGYEPMEDGNILKHSFDLTDETVDTLLSAIRTEPAGEPLTLEQLREMDGQNVLLYRMKSTEPLEPGTVKQNGDVIGDAGMLAYHELYLETWVAFTYPPAHINMEAWSGCVCTASDKSCCTCVSLRCQFCIGESEYKQGRYCSACGRPLTEEARAELEKRLRG